MKKRSLYLYLILLISGIAFGDLNAGETALHRGDYQIAIKELTPLAENGDAKAQFYLGQVYIYTKNYQQAYFWSKKALDSGVTTAKVNLGLLYMNGWGRQQNYKKAYAFLRSMAQQGNKDAQGNLGYLYYHGFGIKTNYKKAVYWYKNSLDHGNRGGASYSLGLIYSNSCLGKSDHKQAIKYYTIAAQEGLYQAMHELGFIYELGTNDGIKPDYVQAYKWLYLAIYQGYEADQPALEILSKKMTAEQIKRSKELAQAFIKKYQNSLIKARHQTSIILNY